MLGIDHHVRLAFVTLRKRCGTYITCGSSCVTLAISIIKSNVYYFNQHVMTAC
jgi:hypothetical protein